MNQMKLNPLRSIVLCWCQIEPRYFNGHINAASFKILHLDDGHAWPKLRVVWVQATVTQSLRAIFSITTEHNAGSYDAVAFSRLKDGGLGWRGEDGGRGRWDRKGPL